MSCINLEKEPTEKGTAVFFVIPTDENDSVLEFADLIDPEFAILYNGEAVPGGDFGDISMIGVDKSITIDGVTSTKNLAAGVVQGDVLAIFGDDDDGKRKFSFQAKYNTTIGSVPFDNSPLNDEANFKIKKLTGQTDITV